MLPAASSDWLLATFFTNQLYFSLLPLQAHFAPNKPSQFQMMESKVLDSWSSMSHVHGAYRDFSSHKILTQLLLHYDSWNKTPSAVFIPAHTSRLYRSSTGISTVPASGQRGLLSKLPFIKVCIIKLGSCLGIPPCLLLPAGTQGQERTPTETAGITFPTGQAGAWSTQLHFGPKSQECFTWNADPAVLWVWSL